MSAGPVPTVDFTEQEVLVAAMKSYPSSGPQIFIDTVADYDATRMVVVRRTLPSNACGSAQAFVAPVDVVVVPRSGERTVWFVERVGPLKGCRRAVPND